MTWFLSRWAEQRRASVLLAFDFPRAPFAEREIMQRVGAACGNRFFVWSGGVPRVLRTLEEDGLTTSFSVPIEFGFGRRRRPELVTRYHELTAQGRAERRILLDGRLL